MSVTQLASEQSLREHQERSAESGFLLVVFVWADFHEPSKAGGQLDQLVGQLARVHSSDCVFVKVNAEEADDVVDALDVEVVPTFVFFKGRTRLGSLQGADTQSLASSVEKYKSQDAASGSGQAAAAAASSSSPLEDRLGRLIGAARVMLFMKGSPQEPRCGFSRQMVNLLTDAAVEFSSFDVLSDEEVRQGLKEYSKWPTYPQLYVDGRLIGGLDVVRELHEEGELGDLRPKAPRGGDTIEDRCAELIKRARVMLFMKGSPETPRCGFSATMVDILQRNGISFESFDILSDEAIRQGLKEYSKWPTYPQLYVGGRLIGGLDIVREMAEEGNLADELGVKQAEPLEKRLQRLIQQARVVLFMKGNPQEPRCGFSREAVHILSQAGCSDFTTFDILSDEEVRQGLKEFSKWPTYPQLYVDGRLVGGLDVVRELHEEGELQELLSA